MDRIDKKILFELDSNARQSFNEIAKKISSSRQVVNNHVEKLLEKGYIQKFLTIFDQSKIGLSVDKIYLRLTRASAKDEEEIIEFLTEHKNVAWVARTEGIYDIAIALHTRDVNELNKVMRDLENKFGTYIYERTVNRVITGEFFHRDYFLEDKKSEFKKKVTFESQEGKLKFDNIDIKIISELGKDARISSVEISKKVKITADAVAKRIKKLEKAGVIKNYILVIDSEKSNQLHYKVLLKIGNFDLETEKKFIDFCKGHKNITFYNKNIGNWEIEIDLEVERSEDFREIMRELKQKFADTIKEYFSLVIYEIRKLNFFPMNEEP